MDTRPFTKSQIFSVIWMAVVVAYLFGGPRPTSVSTPIAYMVVGSTIFSLFTLGKRFPLFGWFLFGLFNGMTGGGRRRW
jgi:hypothetical protein